jgi:hypothetical protein
LKITSIGRPLVLHGTRKAFPKLVRFVEQVKERLQADGERLAIMDSDGNELGAVAGRAVKRGIVPGLQDGPLVDSPDKGKKEE